MNFLKWTVIRLLIICFILFSQSEKAVPSTDSQILRILWWNVQAFNNNGNLVLQTLEDIASNYDVILIGESRSTELEKLRQTSVGKNFRYSMHIEYPMDRSIAISVLSQYPLKLLQTQTLTWGTSEQQSTWIKKYGQPPYNPNRNISFFEITKDNQKYILAPVHFLNPWPIMKSVDGFVSTGFNIYFGESNPLFSQTQQALEKISELGYLNNDLPFILIGDFNSPSNPTLGSTLKYLSRYLTNLMQDNRPTFIAQSLKIDQAFGNSNVQMIHDEVLFFEGSDHYPIEIQVKP